MVILGTTGRWGKAKCYGKFQIGILRGPTFFFFGYVHSAGIPQNGHFRLPTGSHRPVCTLAFDAVLYMGVASSEPSLGSSGVVGVSHALKL